MGTEEVEVTEEEVDMVEAIVEEVVDIPRVVEAQDIMVRGQTDFPNNCRVTKFQRFELL